MKQNATHRRSRNTARALEKGIQIIEYLAEDRCVSRGVREVAGAVGVSPATASRILRIFLNAGWVKRYGESTKVKYAITEPGKRSEEENGLKLKTFLQSGRFRRRSR